MQLFATGLAALVLALSACSTASTEPSAPFTSLGIPNSSTAVAGVHCSGQPDAEQFAAVASTGVSDVISLRPATENGTGWEEAAASAAGVRFHRIPIASPDDLTPDAVRQFDTILKSAQGEAMVYCGSSNRVGALMALRAAMIEGKSADEAIALGKASGLKALEPKVREILLK